jgi:hypothetical protein
MTRNVAREIGIAMMTFVSLAASAHAQSWVTIPMPTISGWSGTVLNTNPPYALGYPPVVHRASYYESASTSNVYGFRFRGDVTVIGTGSSDNNEAAVFFTDSQATTGNEVGLVVNFPQNTMYLYQCGPKCNETGQMWSQTQVWSAPGDYYEYEVVINGTTSFTFNVVSTVSPYQTVYTTTVPRESFISGLANTGYIIISIHNNTADGGSWLETVLHADQVDIWTP